MSYEIGNIMIEDYKEKKYTYIGEVHNGLARVRTKENLYGYINQNGEEVIPCQFQYAADFSEGLALTLPASSKQYQFIKPDGSIYMVCPEKYTQIGSFHDGRALIARGKYQYGYMDKTGKEVIPCQFYHACDFGEGLAIVDDRNSYLRKRMKSVILYSKAYLKFIDVNGCEQRLLIGNYRFSSSNRFHNGVCPIEIVIGREEYNYVPAFIDKKGNIYSEVKTLEARYKVAESPCFLQEEIQNQLISYCSKITFLGKPITLKASSPSDLLEQKKVLFESIKKMVEEAEQSLVSEPVITEKPKEKVKA